LVVTLCAQSGPAILAKKKAGFELIAPSVHPGARVSVKGQLLEDGTVLAQEIEVQKSDDQDDELQGQLTDVDRAGRTFSLLGLRVQVGPKTRITREPDLAAPFDDLSEGMRVKVDGRAEAGGAFRADRIRIYRDQQPRQRVKIEGLIASLEPAPEELAYMVVAGVTARLTLATDLLDRRGVPLPLVRRLSGFPDDEELLFTRNTRIGKHVAVAGEVRLRGERVSNIDLESDTDDVELVPEITGQIGFAAGLGPVYGYLTFVGFQQFSIRSEESFASSEGRARIGEAYFQFPVARGVSMAIGRQRYNDEREWYFNTRQLDAVRLFANLHPVRLEASISRDVFDDEGSVRNEELTNKIFLATYQPLRDLTFEGYYVDRTDQTEREDSPRWLGMRLLGDPGRHWDFWADFALQRGTYCSQLRPGADGELFDTGRRCSRGEEPGEFNVREIEGHAWNAGMTYRPRVRLDPSFTVDYAVASGEDDTVRDVSIEEAAEMPATSFRQTGLQRNRWRYNGVVSFRYYGEVMDPELFNLRILTLDFGLRPARGTSVDLLYHRYRQDKASVVFHEFEIDGTPSGTDPDLGHEWDVAVGYEPTRRYELRLTGGVFIPGPAMDVDATVATVFRFQAKFRF
jgi:hypothetical protein